MFFPGRSHFTADGYSFCHSGRTQSSGASVMTSSGLLKRDSTLVPFFRMKSSCALTGLGVSSVDLTKRKNGDFFSSAVDLLIEAL